MLLRNKNAVIYGAGGAIGSMIARTFAREGAKVFLAGRTREKLEVVAKGINDAGGYAEASQLDALHEEAVESHLAAIISNHQHIDISFNVIDMGETQGLPLTEMKHPKFTLPIETAMRSHFLTSTAAVRYMSKNKSGVILGLTAQASWRPQPNMGGFSVACAAIEALFRQLAVEVGSDGIRVVCLQSAGSPDSPGVAEAMRLHAQLAGVTEEMFEAHSSQRTMLKRLPLMAEVADAAVLMASNRAGIITGTVLDVTCGER